MKVLYLDESGDHQLTKIDPQYPTFVLGGVIVDYDYAVGELTCRLNQLKQRHFGRGDLVLHTADITRNRNGFERLSDATLRQEFYADLNELMRSLDYKVVACAIRKEAHRDRYGSIAVDPYLLSLNVLVERYCMEIGSVDGPGVVIAERRGQPLDREIELAWEFLQLKGTRYCRASRIRRCITEVVLMDKRDNIAGLQLADLVVSPIGRYVSGKAPREDFHIVESKFR